MDEAVASLSAILLDEDYYHFIHSGKLKINDLSILSAAHLIPIKARAHNDLMDRKTKGEKIDDRDIRKHKNDVIRLFQLLSPDNRMRLPFSIQKDFAAFLDIIENGSPVDCKSLGLKHFNINRIIETLREIYEINPSLSLRTTNDLICSRFTKNTKG